MNMLFCNLDTLKLIIHLTNLWILMKYLQGKGILLEMKI